MDRDEMYEFKKLSFAQQEFYLKLKERGSTASVYHTTFLYKQHLKDLELERNRIAISDTSFILLTNNEAVKRALQKLNENKYNPGFNG